jgi:primosomal protein N'
MIAHNYRFQLIIRGTDFSLIHNALRAALSVFKPIPGIYIEIDVDPLSLL